MVFGLPGLQSETVACLVSLKGGFRTPVARKFGRKVRTDGIELRQQSQYRSSLVSPTRLQLVLSDRLLGKDIQAMSSDPLTVVVCLRIWTHLVRFVDQSLVVGARLEKREGPPHGGPSGILSLVSDTLCYLNEKFA